MWIHRVVSGIINFEGGIKVKKFKLLLFAISPLLIGYLIHRAIMGFGWYGIEISIISILFVAYWFFVGYKSYDYVDTGKESILLGNSFAIISIVLILGQIIFLGGHSFNIIGLLPQIFYMPMVRVSSWVERIVLFFIRTRSSTGNLIFSFVLMILIYYAGYKKRIKE